MNQLNAEFQKYYLEYRNLVYHVVFEIIENPETADDLTEDTFHALYVYMKMGKPPIRKLSSWLSVAAKRRAYNYIRDEARLCHLEHEIETGDFHTEVENRIFTREILNRLYNRSERWFDIMEKRYILGLSTKEIAEEYGCAPQAIRNTIARAKKFLLKK